MNKDKVLRQIRVNTKLAKRRVKEGFHKVKQWFIDVLDTQIVIELQEDEFAMKESEHECNCGCENCHCNDKKGE